MEQAYGTFGNSQEMYNYAANQLIVQKLSQQVVQNNLIHKGVSAAEAEIVIQNLMVQIEKNKPAQASAKKAEGKKSIMLGLVLIAIGAIITAASYSFGSGTYVVTYGLMAVGAWQFLKGLAKMF